jgi:hypothetical protein
MAGPAVPGIGEDYVKHPPLGHNIGDGVSPEGAAPLPTRGVGDSQASQSRWASSLPERDRLAGCGHSLIHIGTVVRVAPRFNRRLAGECIVIVGVAVGVAVAVGLPALAHPLTRVASGPQDSLIIAWSLAWVGHALVHRPMDLWDANAFYPARDSLAFTESLVGYAPVAWIGSGPDAALLRFTVLWVLAPALSFVGGYLFARQLGARRLGALIAALAIGFPTWRAGEGGHLHVISLGGVPLALAMLARGHGVSASGFCLARAKPAWALGGWLVAAWQVALSLTVGIPFAYFLGGLAIVGAFHWLRHRPEWCRRLAWANAVGMLVFMLVGLAIAMPYLRVAHRYAAAVSAARGPAIVAEYSPDALAFLRPPKDSVLWHDLATGPLVVVRGERPIGILTGYLVTALAVLGLGWSIWSVRRRLILAGLLAVTLVIGLGTNFPGQGRYTFLFLYEHAPGWAGLRTPYRIVIFTSICLALLACGFVCHVARRITTAHPRVRTAGWGALVLIPAVVLAEGLIAIPYGPVAAPSPAFRAAPAPVLVLPSTWLLDSTPMWWSTSGFPKLGNGASGFTPPPLAQLRRETRGFPDVESVNYLRALGYGSVVVRSAHIRGTPWDGAQLPLSNPQLQQLGIRRQVLGGDVLYLIE